MTFLAREESEDYLRQMKSLSESSQHQTIHVIKKFEEFCKKEYEGRSHHDVFEELILLKKELQDESYKKQLFQTLQLFINHLGDIHEPSYVRVAFSFFKNYLRWNGITIYNEDSKTFLKFPKKLKQQKHVITKDEIKSLCTMASPKRRMLYLVLSSSAMRIRESLQLRKKDFEISNGKLTIHIQPQYTKTKEGRITFISEEAAELVIPYLAKLDEKDLVFGVNENPRFSLYVEEDVFSNTRKKVGFCNCDEVGNSDCNGKYTNSSTHLITIHTLRAFAIKTINRIDFGVGNSLAGHGYYMKRYDAMSIEEKRVIYEKAEPNLSIFTSTKEMDDIKMQNEYLQDEIARLTHRMEQLEKRNL